MGRCTYLVWRFDILRIRTGFELDFYAGEEQLNNSNQEVLGIKRTQEFEETSGFYRPQAPTEAGPSMMSTEGHGYSGEL